MPFPEIVKEDSLVKARRCCCICHEFAGRYTNVHHIIQEADGGLNEIENAIVLCLRCHGEAGHYNSKHPIGNKYSPNELRRHRDEWFTWCEKNPSSPLQKEPISVSPQNINLASDEWDSQTLIKVNNKTNEAFYEIYIKIEFSVSNLHFNKVIIEMVKPKNELTVNCGKVNISTDILRFNGTDGKGNKIIFLRLYSLEPGEVCTLKLKNISSHSWIIENKLQARLSIIDFKNEPALTLSKTDKVAIPFCMPETITIESIAVCLKITE